MVPIETQYIMNTDASSMYYFAGVTLSYGNSNIWTRVRQKGLPQRNKKSFWKDNENLEEFCKGDRVTFTLIRCAAGYIFPIVIQISGLTTAEMPLDKFLVFAIGGMKLIGDVDIR